MSLPQTAEFVALKAAGYNDTQIAAMTRDEQVAHAQVRQNDKYREHAVAAGLKLEDLDSMSSADVFAAIYKSETSASRAQSYGVEKPELTAILENIGVELAGLADRPKQKFTEGGRATFDRATGRLTVAYMQQVIMRTIVGAFVSEVRDAHAVSDLRLYASWLKAWQELYPAIPAPAWMLNQALALEQHDYAGKRECRYPKPGDEADPRLTKPGKMTAMANRVSAKVIETMAVAAVKKCGHGLFDGLLRRVKPLNRNAGHAFAEEFSKCWAGFEMGETEAIRKQYARLAQGVATSLFERSMAGMVDLEPFAKEKEAQCALRIAARWDEWRQAYNDSGNWKTIGGSWELTTEIMKIEGQSWTIEKSFQNMIIMGDIGKGKTSCVAQPITSKLLRAGYGGMVPCVKSGERANFEKLAREAGRGNDLRFISQKHEWEKWGNNVLANMVQMFEDRDEFPNCEQPFEALNIILEFSGSKDINKSQGQNEIFQSTMRDLVRNAINLINLAGDGLNRAGMEAPFSNAFYAWDAALRLDGEPAARAEPTRRFGSFIAAYGPLLAASAPVADAAIAYTTSAYDERKLTAAGIAEVAARTIEAQTACRRNGLTCPLVDLRFAGDAELSRFPLLIVPLSNAAREPLPSVRAKLGRHRRAGHLLVALGRWTWGGRALAGARLDGKLAAAARRGGSGGNVAAGGRHTQLSSGAT